MNTPIEALIAGERAKIELMRSKIQECEQRVATLQAMQADDDLDEALARRLHGAPSGRSRIAVYRPADGDIRAQSVAKTGAAPKKALNETTRQLLRFAEGGNRSIDEFLAFAEQHGINKNRQSMRAFLHQYKATYGLLNSDRMGYFRLSEAGISYLRSIDQPEGATTSAT